MNLGWTWNLISFLRFKTQANCRFFFLFLKLAYCRSFFFWNNFVDLTLRNTRNWKSSLCDAAFQMIQHFDTLNIWVLVRDIVISWFIESETDLTMFWLSFGAQKELPNIKQHRIFGLRLVVWFWQINFYIGRSFFSRVQTDSWDFGPQKHL